MDVLTHNALQNKFLPFREDHISEWDKCQGKHTGRLYSFSSFLPSNKRAEKYHVYVKDLTMCL